MAPRAESALEPDSVRLRRIGLGMVVVIVAALVLSTIFVVGSSDNERGVIVVAPASAPAVSEGDTVRVTGVVRDAVDLGDDARFGTSTPRTPSSPRPWSGSPPPTRARATRRSPTSTATRSSRGAASRWSAWSTRCPTRGVRAGSPD